MSCIGDYLVLHLCILNTIFMIGNWFDIGLSLMFPIRCNSWILAESGVVNQHLLRDVWLSGLLNPDSGWWSLNMAGFIDVTQPFKY